MRLLFIFLAFSLALLSSCQKKALIRFTQREPELHSSDALTQIMLISKSPRIVLRVPNTREGVTNNQGNVQKDGIVSNVALGRRQLLHRRGKGDQYLTELQSHYDDNALYNAIEKQLFQEGFSVRDRGLFNEVLGKSGAVDYSKVSGLTNTDLILELIHIDRAVGYKTNVCYLNKDDTQKIVNDYKVSDGASVEFKLIHVRTNEVVGNYKLHYTPCTEGCRGGYTRGLFAKRGNFTAKYWLKPGEAKEIRRQTAKPYEALDQEELELFIAGATQELVRTMR